MVMLLALENIYLLLLLLQLGAGMALSVGSWWGGWKKEDSRQTLGF